MLSDHDVQTCTGCLEPIRWAITAHGRKQAINAEPDPKGNLAAYTDGTGTLKVRVLAGDRARLEGLEWQAMPHAATCTSPVPRVPRTSSRPGRRSPIVRRDSWRWTR